MKKFILTMMVTLLIPVGVSAITLHEIYKGTMGYLPSVEQRAPVALELCDMENYTGTYNQNLEFVLCLITPDQEPENNEMIVGGSVTKPNTFSPNTVIYSSQINANFDTLYTLVNGNIDDANISDSADIDPTKIENTAIVSSGSSAQTISATTTFSGTLFVSTTSGIFRVPLMTNTQRDALTMIKNGAMIYSKTDTQFYVYEAGSWAGITGAGETAIATNGAKGIVEIGTATEMASSTPAGTGTTNAWLVPDSSITTSSPYTTGKFIPMTDNDGKLGQTFYDLAEDWAFSATTTMATTTMAELTVDEVYMTSTTWDGKDANDLVGGSTTDASDLHTHDALAGFVSSTSQTITISNTTTETDIINTSIGGGKLGTDGCIFAEAYIPDEDNTSGSATLAIDLQYGATTLATLTLNDSNHSNSEYVLRFKLCGDGTTSKQFGMIEAQGFVDVDVSLPSGNSGMELVFGTATIDSTTAQDFKVTSKWSVASAGATVVWRNAYVYKFTK